MSQSWKTVRVFISSTFRDMHAERDHLVRFVFPRLREELLKRRINLVDVDLRWGVTSEQDALEVCREIIDECRPRFLCILGGRYGWVPSGRSESITAAEIHYAALDRPHAKEYRYFYFRDPQVTASIPESAARVVGYREFASQDEIDKFGQDQADALERQRTKKLEVVKEAILDAGFEPFVYPARWDNAQQRVVDLQSFGVRVYADLLSSINDEFGSEAPEAPDEFAEENATMESFAEERAERYIIGSRQTLLNQIAEFAQADGKPNMLVLAGNSGLGKSALLSKFYRDYCQKHPDEIVIPHFVGSSAGSTDLRRTLRRFCYELAKAVRSREEIQHEVKELIKQFPTLLIRVAKRQRVVLLIDALNQLDATDNAHSMYWLPVDVPPGVRIIASSLDHPALEALRPRRERVREIELPPLNPEDGRTIVEGFLQRYRKRMSQEQIGALLAKAESGSPLYLFVALEELRTLGTYEEITERIRELPGAVRPLFLWILKERLSKDPGFRDSSGRPIGGILVRNFVSLMGVSRHGLSQAELAELIVPGDPQGNVAALQRLLRPYLMRRGELLDFYHTQLREVVESKYLEDEQECLGAHRALVEYFHHKADPAGDATWTGNYPRALRELPYHQTQAEMWAELEETLTDLGFVETKCTLSMSDDLVADYNRLGVGVSLPSPPILTAWNHDSRLGIQCPYCLLWQEISTGQLGCIMRCRSCREALNINSFTIDAKWQDSTFDEKSIGKDRKPASVSTAVGEFADFVKRHAHVLRLHPALTFQQAANEPDETKPCQMAISRLSSGAERRQWVRHVNKPRYVSHCQAIFEGHKNPVTALQVSPDGTQVASLGHIEEPSRNVVGDICRDVWRFVWSLIMAKRIEKRMRYSDEVKFWSAPLGAELPESMSCK